MLHDEGGDTLIWDGERCEPTMQPIDTYCDHRMAMAFAPAAFKFGEVRINDPGVVSKSYPNSGMTCGEPDFQSKRHSNTWPY